MITGEIRSKADKIWDTMWSGGISNPLSAIEPLTYLLCIKRLDELDTLRENKANRTGKPIKDPVFSKQQVSLRWSHFKLTPQLTFATTCDEVCPLMKTPRQKDAYDGKDGSTHQAFSGEKQRT